MLPNNAITRVVAEIDPVANDLTERLRHGFVQGEDDFTVRLVDRIEHRVNDLSSPGVTWRAVKLTDRGPGTQEREFGADLLGILVVRTPQGDYAKGFLAQAKLFRQGRALNRKELTRQSDDMLSHTADAFILTYHVSGVRVVSALAVARTTTHPRKLPSWPLSQFFDAHLRSFIGDERLGVTEHAPVSVMREELRAKYALGLEATVGGPDVDSSLAL